MGYSPWGHKELDTREGTRASRRVEEGLSRSLSGGGASQAPGTSPTLPQPAPSRDPPTPPCSSETDQGLLLPTTGSRPCHNRAVMPKRRPYSTSSVGDKDTWRSPAAVQPKTPATLTYLSVAPCLASIVICSPTYWDMRDLIHRDWWLSI